MAREDYTGVPDVSAETQSPDDYEHIQASPASFGSGLAQGTEQAGSGLIDASKFYGQVAADNGTNNTLQQVTSILHGDPNKTTIGPDGQPTPDTGFFGKRGADAMTAREDTAQQIDDIIAENRESLSTPLAKYQYDVDTRRYRAQWATEMGTYSDQQQKVWATDTNNTQAVINLNTAARNAADPTAAATAQDKVRNAYVKNAQLNGEDTQGAILKADQDVSMARIRALSASTNVDDRVMAQKVLTDNAGVLGSLPGYDQIVRGVRQSVIEGQMAPTADGLINDAVTNAQGSTSTGATSNPYVTAVGGRETDHLANAATAKNPRSSATGTDQFIGKTWYDPQHPEASVMGQPEFSSIIAGKTPEQIEALRTDPSLQAQATLVYARMNGPHLQAAGEPVNAATLGLAHGYGPAGAVSILKAAPDTPMSQVLPGIIHANPDLANQTAGQVVQQFTRRFGTGAVDTSSGTSGQYPSTTDALRANMAATLTQARTVAEQKFPGDPDAQDRLVERVERGINQQVSQQDQQYTVDTHIVQAALAGPSAPINEDQLTAVSPEVAAAWQRMQISNPLGAVAVERRFDANSHGQATTYGTEAKDYVDRVLADLKDPGRISNAAQLNGFVGPGDDAPLTNTGVDALSGLLTARAGPQGDAFASQAKAFLDNAYGQLSFSNKAAALRDAKGDAAYTKFLAQALPILVSANKSGTLGKVLDPKSPDYLGNVAGTFARSPAQMVRDRLSDEGETGVLGGQMGPQFALRQAVATGRISRDEGVWIAQKLGYISGAPTSSPVKLPKPDNPNPISLFTQSKDANGDVVAKVNDHP